MSALSLHLFISFSSPCYQRRLYRRSRHVFSIPISNPLSALFFLRAAQEMISQVQSSLSERDSTAKAASRRSMVDSSMQSMLRDKAERHERERRTAELLAKGDKGPAVDDDPTLWSFR